ncbi:MAG: D-alanyl-D-alanine carboxypeptidase [Eubacterium sp.]|nr:D-alanyl-D-alanine carboxypeptidase [Eubacterium sp.]
MDGTQYEQKRDREPNTHKTLMLVLALIAIGAILLMVLVRRNSLTYPVDVPYDLHKQNGANALSEFSLQTGKPISDGLVVTAENVDVPGLVLTQEECKGLLFNLEKTEAVFSRNIYRKVYPASLTKMMTAVLALEYGSMNETVQMKEEDFDLDEGAQVSSLMPGDLVTMEQLFHLLVIYSSNDAAMAIARTVAGDVSSFVDMMNQRAKELSMTGTHFTNPTGLHDENMYTTAYDVYIMMLHAYSYQEYLNVSQMSEYTVEVSGSQNEPHTVYHTSTDQYLTNDRALPAGVRILASKTGTTDPAGSCLALVVQNDYGVPYVAIMMGAWDKDNLYANMTSLLNLTMQQIPESQVQASNEQTQSSEELMQLSEDQMVSSEESEELIQMVRE